MKKLQDFRAYCLEENYPIVCEDALNFILGFLDEQSEVLELGTCVGYSAISMALRSGATIHTLERDFERHVLAKQFVKDFEVEDKVKCIYDDALVFDPHQQYDVIFFDAAKAQNQVFFDRFFPYLKPNGTLFIDNMDFHGIVGKSDQVKNRNLRKMVKAIASFEESICLNEQVEVSHYSLGDGLLVIKSKAR